MTNLQKTEIIRLHSDGMNYNDISEILGIPKNTVKTFCWRYKKSECDASDGVISKNESRKQCEYCEKPLIQQAKQKPRRFCTEACRLAWWSENRNNINQKAVYSLVCTHCKTDFESYGNKNRKYCCHECYIAARFGNREAVVYE
jgi:transposase